MDLEDLSTNPVSGDTAQPIKEKDVVVEVKEEVKEEVKKVEVKEEVKKVEVKEEVKEVEVKKVEVKEECCEEKKCCEEKNDCCEEDKKCCIENTCCDDEVVDVTTQMLVKKEAEKEIIDLTKEDDDDDEEGMSQDTKQQVNTTLALVLELYRAVMGCLLVIFVPQDCDGVSCSVSDNINNAGSGISLAGLIFNLLTLASLSGMYYYETRREFKMISYLESNSYKARDAESVEEALTKLSPHRKERILKLNVNYGRFGYASLALFGINSAVSGIVVFNNFLDAKTLTVFLTNVLFMSSKLGNVYEIIHTEPNIFYSAFLTRKVQYNDVDPDKVEEIKLEV